MKKIGSINIWGDSILKGIVYSEADGKYRPYKNCAVHNVAESFPEIVIKNFSRFGNTIRRGEEQLVKSVASGKTADMTIIEFGGNDCDFNWEEVSAAYKSEHIPNTPIEIYRESLKNIVGIIKGSGSIPVIMNLPPINAEMYFDWFCRSDLADPEHILSWLCEKQIIYRTQECYSHVADMTAKELDVPIIDVRTKFLEIRNYSDYLCIDGIHLTEKGQALLGEIMTDSLRKIISEL